MCEYICGGNSLSYDINFNDSMSIDTTKVNHYTTTEAIQDTIYDGEPYVFTVRLITPYFKNGMYVVLIDSEEEYCDLNSRNYKTQFECEGFEKRIAIKDYIIGNNQIRGMILNYDNTMKKNMRFYFSKNFYVKQIEK